MGWFSSDRTIRQYAEEIWGVETSKGLSWVSKANWQAEPAEVEAIVAGQ